MAAPRQQASLLFPECSAATKVPRSCQPAVLPRLPLEYRDFGDSRSRSALRREIKSEGMAAWASERCGRRLGKSRFSALDLCTLTRTDGTPPFCHASAQARGGALPSERGPSMQRAGEGFQGARLVR